MTTIGIISFLVIGLIMGLIGGGGSILGVPILVYIIGIQADVATTYSLFIVGLTSVIGAIAYLRKGEISVEAILQFALASMVSVFCVRKYLMPAIPETFYAFNIQFSKQIIIMLLFSVLILVSSYSMIKKRKPNKANQVKLDEFAKSPIGIPSIILMGVLVGAITGFIGAGGGFIIVPVLMFFLRLNFKKAIGTSLCIVAINSLVGFMGNIGQHPINWMLLFTISAVCILGIIVGSYFSDKIPAKKLKPAFGWFTLCVGLFVLIKESFF